jgi:hypothetical protein
MGMVDKVIILNLLNQLSRKDNNIFWKMECLYADAKGTTINQIKLYSQSNCRNIGTFVYRGESGMVQLCMHKNLKKSSSENIIDLLLDLINDSKENKVIQS